MPISATSPAARSRASGIGGVAAAGEDDRQPLGRPRDELAGDQADVRRLVDEVEVVEDQHRAVFGDRRAARAGRPRSRPRASGRRSARSLSSAAVVGANAGIVLASGGDEVAQERDPVAVVVIEPVPEGPEPGPPREVGQERRLAVAGVGEDEDHPVMDLGREPIEQAVAGQGLVAQRRTLDLRGLDRIPVHSVARAPCGDGPAAAGRQGRRRPAPTVGRWAVAATGEAARTIRSGSREVSTEVSGPGMRAIMAAPRSSAD